MTFIPGMRRLFRLGGLHDVESAVDDELRFHMDMTVRELVAGGMREDEARREAERRFGDVEAARARLASLDRERVNAERRADWWSALGQDLRYALRGLRLKPGFTAGVVLTLGLGIGANATMFGVVDRLLFRPPTYMAHAGRVHRLYFARNVDGVERFSTNTSFRRLLDMQRFTHHLDVVAGARSWTVAIGTGESSAELPIHGVSADFWRLFEMRPPLGRFFGADEDSVPETAHVAVLGYGFWRSRFGGSPGVLGQQVRIGRNDYTIVGVAPRGYQGVALTAPAAIIPLTALVADEIFGGNMRRAAYRTTYDYNFIGVIARRRAGATAEHAAGDLSAAFRRSYEQQLAEQPGMTPAAVAQPRVIAAAVQSARGPNRGRDVSVAIWLVGVAAIVLIIACANVGNLLLARAFSRRREIAVRLALGVGRSRLLAQLLTESVVLASLGGVAGLVLAQWGGGVLRATLLPDAAWTSTLADTRTIVVCAAVALVVGMVTGLAPAWHALRSDLAAALKSGAREGTLHRSRSRTAMLVVQGVLSVVLLVGAGLFVTSVRHAEAVHLGYDSDKVLYVETKLRNVTLPDAERDALQRRLLERAQSLPGVERAAQMLTMPFQGNWSQGVFTEGVDSASGLGPFERQEVSPEYFSTTGTRLLRGRGIEAQDRQGAPRVMVVSESMARVLWPGREALGRCVRVGADTVPCTTVVGVAEDIKSSSLGDDPGLLFYLSIEQFAGSGGLFVRTRGSAAAAASSVRRALQELLPGAAYVTVTPLGDLVASERRSWVLGATMFTIFGALALLVASVGLYSVVSYGVAQRSHELAVRSALGAQVRDIVRMVVGEGLRTVLAATAIGLAAAWLAARWVGPLLFQTSPRDPVVFGGVAALLIVVALVASAIPALRAARVDPVTALRAD